MNCDKELTAALQTAFQNAVSSLREEHNEHFYYYAFIFDEGLHPYISAWSSEAYERSLVEDEVGENEKDWWKWDHTDSPYAVYGYDEYFSEAAALLDKRADGLSLDELYDDEWDIRIASMEQALRQLDDQGFFGVGKDRENVVINVEVAPPDGKERQRALRLNPSSPLLSEYLENCEDDE